MAPVHLTVVALSGALASGSGSDAGGRLVIHRDPDAGAAVFAAGEIRRALAKRGRTAVEKSLAQFESPARGTRIVLARKSDAVAAGILREARRPAPGDLPAQGYILRRAGGSTYWVVGADLSGTMYGGLRLAEMIRLDGLGGVEDTAARPAIPRRGIKFNIPLDARTPSYDDTGDAAQANIVHMWDAAFWREFLDDLARHHYNTLTLWNPHPFPSIVKCPDYPDVALDDVCVTKVPPDHRTHREWRDEKYCRPENLRVVRKMTIDEKIAFWRGVMEHARRRGIDIYWITWNVHTDGATGKYGITPTQTNPKTIAYVRECVRETIKTYPLLAGIGVTAGERMQHRKGKFAKEKWLWQAYGEGVLDARKAQPGRRVRFLHRCHQSSVRPIAEDFASRYGGDLDLGFKYARAHMYSSPKVPFADGLCRELKAHKLRCWWNLRNDDIFHFRWGDPDYVREFLANLPPAELTAGYHMGSDGYVWGRTHSDADPKRRGRMEIRKHWYAFMLWGRLGYEPTLGRALFEKVLADRFPQADAAALYDAWQQASRIIPLVNRFHWRDWDFMWAPEGCLDHRKGFHTIEDFIQTAPMEASGIVSIPDYVRAELAGREPDGIAPTRVAANLRRWADQSRKLVTKLRAGAKDADTELSETLADIEAMGHLGRYYGVKILGALELHASRTSGDARRRAAAVQHLEAAAEHWQAYAAAATRLYRPQLLARTRRMDWNALLSDVRKDIELARKPAAPKGR